MPELNEEEWTEFEKWLTAEIRNKTDADPEVVAEYIVALLKSQPDIKNAYQRCLTDIPEFFAEGVNAEKVLTTIFDALKRRSFLPQAQDQSPQAAQPSPIPAWQPQAGRPFHHLPQAPHRANRTFDPSAVPFTPAGVQYGRGGTIVQTSRKRAWHEALDGPTAAGYDPHYGGGERQIKQMRRGGRERGTAVGRGIQRSGMKNGRGAHGAGPAQAFASMPPTAASAAAVQQRAGRGTVQLPGQAQQFSLDDMQRLLESLAAMSAAMGMPLPPGLPSLSSDGAVSSVTRKPCFAFQKKGFCARGSACPYRHSVDVIDGHRTQQQQGTETIGAQHGGSRRKVKGHAEFSSNHAPPDGSATSIVVEHIPEDHLSEDAVREFYTQFGEVAKIELKEDRRLAIVKYADYESARKAWESPKVVFDNRFVRVYWYRPEMAADLKNDASNEHTGTNGHAQDQDMFDAETFAKIAEDRQKEHEERQRKLQELNAQRSEIASKLKTYTNTKRELIEKLAEQDPHGLAEGEDGTGGQLTWEKKKATEALRERLAAIEAQAESLGLKGEEEDDFTRGFSTSSRGRGHRGFRGRARGQRGGSLRGAYHGSPQGSVLRLDNRPKSLVVSLSKEDEGREWTAEHDEALRSFLVAGYEFDAVARHPERRDSQVVVFKERYMAEMFAAAAHSLPGIGHVWLAWAPRELSVATSASDRVQVGSVMEDGEVKEENVQQQQQPHGLDHAMVDDEEDFDIA